MSCFLHISLSHFCSFGDFVNALGSDGSRDKNRFHELKSLLYACNVWTWTFCTFS